MSIAYPLPSITLGDNDAECQRVNNYRLERYTRHGFDDDDDDDDDNKPVWPNWAVGALFRGVRRI